MFLPRRLCRESLPTGRGLRVLPLTLLLSCWGAEPATESSSPRALDDAPAAPVCLWIDFDGTLNTIGAFGWPFNPVPATELCELLADRADAVRATPLTARAGCWPSFQPSERACRVLQPTISVACSTGLEAAWNKDDEIRWHDADCSRHVLLDDNSATTSIAGGDPRLDVVHPTPWEWPSTRAAILQALDSPNLPDP